MCVELCCGSDAVVARFISGVCVDLKTNDYLVDKISWSSTSSTNIIRSTFRPGILDFYAWQSRPQYMNLNNLHKNAMSCNVDQTEGSPQTITDFIIASISIQERFCAIWLLRYPCRCEIVELYIQDSTTSSTKIQTYRQQLDLKLP